MKSPSKAGRNACMIGVPATEPAMDAAGYVVSA
jgi:hypothetical protein